MKKTIIAGTILSVFLMVIIPNISAIQYQQMIDTQGIISILHDNNNEFNINREDISSLTTVVMNEIETMKKFLTEEQSIREIYQGFQNFIITHEKQNYMNNILIEENRLMDVNSDISKDFEEYLNWYLRLIALLYTNVSFNQEVAGYEKPWSQLRILGLFFKETNYYDWAKNAEDKIEGFRYTSVFIGAICVIATAISGVTIPLIDPIFGSVLCAIFGFVILFILYFNADVAAYMNNGNEAFEKCRDMEVNIIIHLMDNGTNIPEYKLTQPIKAESIDAMNWIGNTERPDIGKDKNNFKYELGKSITMNTNGQTGWYSLENRDRPFEDPLSKYTKAPCPPGKWKIQMSANEYYNGFVLEDLVLNPGETLIIYQNLTNIENI